MKRLILVKLDANYCNYLRQYDNRVPYNYDRKDIRPFIGVIFEIDSYMYFAPLSSPKKKHQNMKNTLDFMKIDSGKLGAINFNNMVPVKDDNVVKLDFKEKDRKYGELLNDQIIWLNHNKDKIFTNSKKLYNKYIDVTLNLNIRNRCCNFKLLEEKCNEYNKK